ncbi:MAG: hypothetical protein ACR2NP_21800 [Pirellulaceae bacterium]
MNCFAHGWRFLDADPYFVVGTALPDWLTLVDRKVRVREKNAAAFSADSNGAGYQLARGIVQHHRDDDWFHNQREFVELNLQFAIELRDLLGADAGFRPHLAGHILIEVLLDGFLTEKDSSRLDLYYQRVSEVDAAQVEEVVNRIAQRSTSRIAEFIPHFIEEGYLYDYVDDVRVRYRLNRVLKRVGLVELPISVLDWLPDARQRVYEQALSMLTEPNESPESI